MWSITNYVFECGVTYTKQHKCVSVVPYAQLTTCTAHVNAAVLIPYYIL